MWLLILLAVHANNPNDNPAKIQIQFQTQKECEVALSKMTFWVKYEPYIIKGRCEKDLNHN